MVVAAPAPRAARLLEGVDELLAGELGRIEYASCAVVTLAFQREQIQHPIQSFGFVVPRTENCFILSCSFSSEKYEGRAPEESVLMRVFIGGALQPGLMRLSNVELMELAHWELARLLKIDGEPLVRHVTRQRQAMPQYHVGHIERIKAIEQRLACHPSLAVAGSALYGVGVPSCIESGQDAAQRVVNALAAEKQVVDSSKEHPISHFAMGSS